jgi:hypothetical protein
MGLGTTVTTTVTKKTNETKTKAEKKFSGEAMSCHFLCRICVGRYKLNHMESKLVKWSHLVPSLQKFLLWTLTYR